MRAVRALVAFYTGISECVRRLVKLISQVRQSASLAPEVEMNTRVGHQSVAQEKEPVSR